MNIERKHLTLRTGKPALWEYDPAGDLLEIVFQAGEATCAVELTDNMVLRFDWEKNEPLSLSIMGASHVMQPGQYGDIYFELLAADWTPEVRDKVIAMLTTPPLTEFLIMGSYAPAHTQQLIPLTSIKHADWSMQPA